MIVCAAGLSFGIYLLSNSKSPALETVVERPVLDLNPEPSTLDFGKLNQQSKQQKGILLRNQSSQPIHVLTVLGSCGCTATDFAPTLLQPTETHSITVSLMTGRKRGNGTELLYIRYRLDESEKESQLIVPVKSDVQPDYRLSPDRVQLAKREPKRIIQLLSNDTSKSFRILSASCENQLVQCELLNDRRELLVRVDPEKFWNHNSAINTTVFVRIDIPDHDILSIPVTLDRIEEIAPEVQSRIDRHVRWC